MDEIKKLLITTSVTIFLAFAGLLAKYLNDLSLARRKDKLERVEKQLGQFYGPLYSLLKSNEQAWLSLRQKLNAKDVEFDPRTPSEEQLTIWKHYMKTIYIPTNERIYDIIVSKSDLLIEEEMPECLMLLVGHIVAYKTVAKNWELGDSSETVAIISFPQEARTYIYSVFESLKKHQYTLLHG